MEQPEKLVVTKADDYDGNISVLRKLGSGAVFEISPLNAYSTVQVMGLMEDEDLGEIDEDSENAQIISFVKKHLDTIINAIMPSIVAPKISSKVLIFTDVVELFAYIMDITGLTADKKEERDEFRDQPTSDEP